MVFGLGLLSPFKGETKKNSKSTSDEDSPPSQSSKARTVFGLSFISPFKGERNRNSARFTVEESTSDDDPPSSQPTDPSKRSRTPNFPFSSPLVRKKRKNGTPSKKSTTLPAKNFPFSSPLVRKMRKTGTPAKKSTTPVTQSSRRKDTPSKQSTLKRRDSHPLSFTTPNKKTVDHGVTFSDVLEEEPRDIELDTWEATPAKKLPFWLYADGPGEGVSTPMTPTGSCGSASKVNPANWSVSRRLGPQYDAESESFAIMVDEEMDEEMDEGMDEVMDEEMDVLSEVVNGSSTEDDAMRDANESFANLSIVEFDIHEVDSSEQEQGLLDLGHSDVDNDNFSINNASNEVEPVQPVAAHAPRRTVDTQAGRSTATHAVFLPGGSGKSTKIRWKEPDTQSIANECRNTRSKRNQAFRIATATAVDSDLSLLEKRLASWYKSDEKVKEAVNNIVSISANDTPDHDIVVKNLQDFVRDHSKRCSGSGGGGTRTIEEQRAVEVVIIAANWSEELEPKTNASIFGITIAFARKLINMAKSHVIKSKRKTRKDTILPILRPYVYKFCHDDFVARVDTGGKTARNFVNFVDLDGNDAQHSRRVWTWATRKEKFNHFLLSKYYVQYVEELKRNPYFNSKFDEFVLEAEKKLRHFLGRDEDDKLTKIILLGELENRQVESKKNSSWSVLVMLLYRNMFDDPLTENDVAGAEIKFLSMYTFLKCLCPCVVNPVMESCVDIILNQVMIYARSLGEALTRNKRLKEAFAQCQCANCKIFRDKNDKQKTLNDLLVSFTSTYKLIEYTCCDASYFPEFKTEQDTSTPRLIPRNCTEADKVCEHCGVDRKFAQVYKCPVWKSSEIIVKTQEYRQMPRSGTTSNGDQRTVLDLVAVKYTLSEAVKRLLDTLRDARRHLNDT